MARKWAKESQVHKGRHNSNTSYSLLRAILQLKNNLPNYNIAIYPTDRLKLLLPITVYTYYGPHFSESYAFVFEFISIHTVTLHNNGKVTTIYIPCQQHK